MNNEDCHVVLNPKNICTVKDAYKMATELYINDIIEESCKGVSKAMCKGQLRYDATFACVIKQKAFYIMEQIQKRLLNEFRNKGYLVRNQLQQPLDEDDNFVEIRIYISWDLEEIKKRKDIERLVNINKI